MRKRALERSGDSVRAVGQGRAVPSLTRPRANSEPNDPVSPRDAEVDLQHGIHVTRDGSKMILTGTVRSWAERRAAEHAAWQVAGVCEVDDRLVVVGVHANRRVDDEPEEASR
jgi:hypothetical protein